MKNGPMFSRIQGKDSQVLPMISLVLDSLEDQKR